MNTFSAELWSTSFCVLNVSWQISGLYSNVLRGKKGNVFFTDAQSSFRFKDGGGFLGFRFRLNLRWLEEDFLAVEGLLTIDVAFLGRLANLEKEPPNANVVGVGFFGANCINAVFRDFHEGLGELLFHLAFVVIFGDSAARHAEVADHDGVDRRHGREIVAVAVADGAALADTGVKSHTVLR